MVLNGTNSIVHTCAQLVGLGENSLGGVVGF